MKSPFNPLTVECVKSLEKFLPVLANIDDGKFKACHDSTASIGRRVWSSLNLLENLLAGIEAGTLNYSRRVANRLVAQDRSFALMEIYRVISTLEELSLRNRFYPLRRRAVRRGKVGEHASITTNFDNEILRLQKQINANYEKIVRALIRSTGSLEQSGNKQKVTPHASGEYVIRSMAARL